MAATTKGGATLSPPKSTTVNLMLYQFTVEQYQQMEKEGMFGSDRVELLEGYVVKKSPMNPPHAISAERVLDELRARLPVGWCLRSEKDIALVDSQPLPDAVIAAGCRDDYADHHPGPNEVALVVEVSDSTLEQDQTTKLRIYARARIRVYWIVNIPERRIEVYTQPRAGQNPRYLQRQIFAPTDSVSVTVGSTVVGPIPVANLLPPG